MPPPWQVAVALERTSQRGCLLCLRPQPIVSSHQGLPAGRGVGRGGAVVALRGLPGCELWERWVSRPRIVSVHRYSTLSTHDFLRRSLACIAYGIVAPTPARLRVWCVVEPWTRRSGGQRSAPRDARRQDRGGVSFESGGHVRKVRSQPFEKTEAAKLQNSVTTHGATRTLWRRVRPARRWRRCCASTMARPRCQKPQWG